MITQIADSEGSVPLWEAMLGGHESVINLLIENGATLQSGDVGHFACTAVEQNNLTLLRDILRYGGDIKLPRTNNGTTALHVAVCEDNVEMVKFLMKHGCDIDKPDKDGWTPRELADQQGHEEIKAIFEATGEPKAQSVIAIPERQGSTRIRYLGRFTSEPTMPLSQQDGSFPGTDGSWGGGGGRGGVRSRPRRRSNNYHNSLFGIMSAAHKGEKEELMFCVDNMKRTNGGRWCNARVTISCPEKAEVGGKLVLLPESLRELIEIGAKKFGVFNDNNNVKVLSKDGAEIDDIEVVRDGDHLLLVSAAGGTRESNCPEPPLNGGVL